jgi:lactose/cellobiose-specific phosphotransferase system IIC component
MQENMAAFAAGHIPPHIIVLPFRDLYGHMGGTGSTLALLLAIMLRSRMSSHKKFARTVIAPGVFNINEPVIFGLPVILNPLLMIPLSSTHKSTLSSPTSPPHGAGYHTLLPTSLVRTALPLRMVGLWW